MHEPALTPEQWQRWRATRLLEMPWHERTYGLASGVGSQVVFHCALHTPAEYRAAIAVLLDALAQAGEPLLTREDEFVLDAVVPSHVMQVLEIHGERRGTVGQHLRSLSARIASLLPPEGT